MSEHTGRTVEEIARDSERDNFLTATEAVEYGLIDQVCKSVSKILSSLPIT